MLRSLTPGLNYFTKRYSRRWLRADSIAGLAVAAYLIPQVMAYSAIVNVPPVASLWAALAAIVAYVVLGSSRIVSPGPESTIALMTGVAIAPLAAQNPDRAVALSATLALIVAGWALLARLLRAGIAELLSTPLLVGYLAGGAVLMVVGQLGGVTGTSFEGGTIVEEVRGFLGVATDTDWLTLAIAASTLAVILLLRWLGPSLPGPLIAVVLATVASIVFDLESHGVAVVGQVPSGLPVPHLPEVTFEDVKMLLLAGLGITIVGYSDIMLIARGFRSPPPRERPRLTSGPTRRPNLPRWRVCTRWSASSAAIRSPRPGRVRPWRSPVARAARSTRWSPGCASSPSCSLPVR